MEHALPQAIRLFHAPERASQPGLGVGGGCKHAVCVHLWTCGSAGRNGCKGFDRMPSSCCHGIWNHTPLWLMRLLIKKNSLCQAAVYKAEVSALSPSLTTLHPVVRWGCAAHGGVRGCGTRASVAAARWQASLGHGGGHGASQLCHHCCETSETQQSDGVTLLCWDDPHQQLLWAA